MAFTSENDLEKTLLRAVQALPAASDRYRLLLVSQFFHSRAADLYLKRTGEHYEAAEHDLKMVRGFKSQQAQPARA